MTVKCLTRAQKDAIVFGYTRNKVALADLSKLYSTSTRTIGRVLEEYGLALPVPRLKGEAYLALKACAKHGIRPDSLDTYIVSTLGKTSLGNSIQFIADASAEDLIPILVAIHERIDLLLVQSPLPKAETSQPMSIVELFQSIPTNPITPSELTHAAGLTA